MKTFTFFIFAFIAFGTSIEAFAGEPPQGTLCAGEGGYCSFRGTKLVSYGVNGKIVQGLFKGGVSCSNDVFGDPAPYAFKYCSISLIIPTNDFQTCANEGQTCEFFGNGEVRYGVPGHYVTRIVYGWWTGSTPCDNYTFGDPAPGVPKTCEVRLIQPIETYDGGGGGY